MERKLAAILAADVVGYSRLMGEDEAGTLNRVTSLWNDLVQPIIEEHRGRTVKLIGDGLLAEFPSVVEAVQCAVDIQNSIAGHEADLPDSERVRLRVGVNLGDIIAEGSDIYGEGVNVAARLEGLADPGGICVSGTVFDHVRGKTGLNFADLGERQVKNIELPVRVFRVALDGEPTADAALDTSAAAAPGLEIPNKPSIAVLPFSNMSADPDQEYFADGVVEEIITALSRIRWLFVIARNSSFTYKGRAVDIKEVGRNLGVRYVLEGSVRKAGSRMRITGQLIDAATGAHLWADRFDGALEDVFDLQDQVTASVVGAIAPRLEKAEIERAKRKPTKSLDAYDYYLRGLAAVHEWKREANEEALSLFSRAIRLDPNFAAAYGMAARCYSMRKASGWMADPVAEVDETIRLARRAVELGKDDAVALSTAGIGLAFVAGQLDEGAELIDQALRLDPNLAWAWLFSGWANVWRGQHDAAIEDIEHAKRLSPHDPHNFAMQSATASAHFFRGRYAEALSLAKTAMRTHTLLLATCVAAASAGLIGDVAEAEAAIRRLHELDPTLCMSNLKNLFPIRHPEDFAHWADGLRKAGLPE